MTDAELGAALAGDVDEVVIGAPGRRTYLTDPSIADALAALRDSNTLVLAEPEVLAGCSCPRI